MQAGCVPVRRDAKGNWQVLLVQSRWTPEVWLFPKGGVEKGELAKQAAVRETREEAGVDGFIGPKLGTWLFTKSADQKHKMWILFVAEQYAITDKRWKERKKRSRVWLSLDDAHSRLTTIPKGAVRPELAEMLLATRQTLAVVTGNGTSWKADIEIARRAVIARQAATGSTGDGDAAFIPSSLAAVTENDSDDSVGE
jgi:8-oxo-dGTP pyrophosphatase MutT (NUDIX family)